MAPAMHVDYVEPNRNLSKKKDTMMGKKTKGFSRGYSSGFVSDYRHAVDSMAESEGLGSSGRVEVDSDDSSAPKRKCISLNVDRSSDGCGIPVEVFSIDKMSRSERKKLEMRFREDLERVQKLQKRITLQGSNSVAMSSSSDVRSCSEGKKGPLSKNMHKSLEYSSKQGIKKAPFVSDSHNLKRSHSGRLPSVKQDNSLKQEKLPNFQVSKLMEQCEALLKRVMEHEYSWVFLKPVDVVELNIPDYFDVIKHPMDLGTIKRRIQSRLYANPLEFVADVRLTFSNAQTYNPPNNDVHIMAKTLSKYFEARWKNIQKKLPPINSVPMNAKPSVSKELKGPRTCSPSKKRKISSLDHEIRSEPVVKMEPVKRTMTDMDKQNLTRDIESLIDELPTNIVVFLREHSCKDDETDPEEEVTVEIEALSDDVLFTLRKLVDDYLQEKQRNSTKVVPCEGVLNKSGVRNSPMQPCKGNEPVDEDVDIGGNDLPASSYPPVEIEKDSAHVRSKCSSSSSSSSDSSSSSSDSDSGSSSGDSDDEKASSPVNRKKEINATSHASSLDGLDQLEQNNPISREEGENPQLERAVSPDKLYRAAVMRNRFADTILKAREKTLLNKGENADPEKLRREREELEKLRREEKARLQAEAKVAEESRRKVEAEAAAEAAAEAKRKRELERKAARLALQKMEKTVEINENCHFLESLEILGSSSVDAPVLSDEDSEPGPGPVVDESCVDEMGGFKLQGSNPLERLGLYMKMDDDEEEEVEPTRAVPHPAQDEDEDEDENVEID